MEGLLLAVSLAAVRKSSDCDLRASISNVETDGILCEIRYAKSFQCVEVEFVDLVAIEAEEEMNTSWRIVAIDDRIDGGDQNLRVFVVDRKDYNNLWRRRFSEDLLHPLLASQLGSYVLPDAKYPWNTQYDKEGVKGNPLQDPGELFWKVLRGRAWKWQGKYHNRQEDHSVPSQYLYPSLWSRHALFQMADTWVAVIPRAH